MVINVADALAAYRQTGKATGAAATGDTAGGASFGEFLKDFAGKTVDTLKEGEKAASAAATGKADLASVVTAISNAELALQEVVAIRDKVVAAYQDISKTAI